VNLRTQSGSGQCTNRPADALRGNPCIRTAPPKIDGVLKRCRHPEHTAEVRLPGKSREGGRYANRQESSEALMASGEKTMRKTRKPGLNDIPDTVMRLMGIDHHGKAVWIKNYGSIQGVIITENPEEAKLFGDHAEVRLAFSQVVKTNRLRNVAVQFVRTSRLFGEETV
jgi:hypothetical protein